MSIIRPVNVYRPRRIQEVVRRWNLYGTATTGGTGKREPHNGNKQHTLTIFDPASRATGAFKSLK